MWTKEFVYQIVENFIKTHEKIGECAGESGHSAYVSLEIQKIYDPKENKLQEWTIEFEFLLTIETEFKFYPNNPPYQYKYQQRIVIDDKGTIIRYSNKTYG